MRIQCKPNGDRYWEYVLMYVDDIMCVSHDPQSVLDAIGQRYKLKPGSVGELTSYLGADALAIRTNPDGQCNPTSIQCSVKEVESKLAEINRKLPELIICLARSPAVTGIFTHSNTLGERHFSDRIIGGKRG
jgi:hypothetical protein